jgi:hypothetical protein
LQADGDHEFQFVVADRRRSWATPVSHLWVRSAESQVAPKQYGIRVHAPDAPVAIL